MTTPGAAHTDLAPTGLPYRIPSLTRRVVVAAVILVVFLLVYIVLPTTLLARLTPVGLLSPIPPALIVAGGAALAALSAARYLAKPTRVYGPVWTVGSAAAIAYLVLLLPYASFSISPGHGGSFSLDYRVLLEVAMVIPGLRLLSGVVTTVEDARHPKERLPYDFPA
jgi:hypothetical protein